MSDDSSEKKLDDFRKEVREQMSSVGDELKELTKALRDLIRLDGDIRRIQDAVGRIGRQADDHEIRVRRIESLCQSQEGSVKNISNIQMMFMAAGFSFIGALVTGLVMRFLYK